MAGYDETDGQKPESPQRGFPTPDPGGAKPVTKPVAGGLGAAIALIVIYILQQVGLPVSGELSAAITAVVGAIVAYAKSEDYI